VERLLTENADFREKLNLSERELVTAKKAVDLLNRDKGELIQDIDRLQSIHKTQVKAAHGDDLHEFQVMATDLHTKKETIDLLMRDKSQLVSATD
jgi:hypothetical protein